MQLKISTFILFSFFLLMSRCEDPFPAGLETTVSGSVIDETIDIPLEGQKLRLLENLQNAPSRYIDSTITDIDGYYTMTFTTSGEGLHYFLEAEETNSIWTQYNGFREIDSIGDFNTIDFSFVKLYPYTITITGENLVDTTILIRNLYTHSGDIESIEGSNFLETRDLFISPYYNHQLEFYRTLDNGDDQKYYHFIEASNNYEQNEVNITLTDELFETIE